MTNGRILVDKHRHLFAQCRVAGSAFVLHSIAIHADLEALFQSARSTLIAMRFVDLAQSVGLRLAHILSVAANAALEEASTAVAGVDSVVLSRAVIAADLTWHVVEDST